MVHLSILLCFIIGATNALTVRKSWQDDDDEKWGAIVDKIQKDNDEVKDAFRKTMKKQDEIEDELNELENVFQKDASEPGKDSSKPEKRSSLEGEALMRQLMKVKNVIFFSRWNES